MQLYVRLAAPRSHDLNQSNAASPQGEYPLPCWSLRPDLAQIALRGPYTLPTLSLLPPPLRSFDPFSPVPEIAPFLRVRHAPPVAQGGDPSVPNGRDEIDSEWEHFRDALAAGEDPAPLHRDEGQRHEASRRSRQTRASSAPSRRPPQAQKADFREDRFSGGAGQTGLAPVS